MLPRREPHADGVKTQVGLVGRRGGFYMHRVIGKLREGKILKRLYNQRLTRPRLPPENYIDINPILHKVRPLTYRN